MEEVIKRLKKMILPMLWLFVCIVASAGAMNSGEPGYIVAGVINLGLGIYSIAMFVKKLAKEQKDEEK